MCLWQQEGVRIQTSTTEEENSRSLEERQVRALEMNLFPSVLGETEEQN